MDNSVNGNSAGGGYDFHDPDFVKWWLQSLYLVDPESQVGIAQAVSERIQVPAVKAVCAEFAAGFDLAVGETDVSNRPAPQPALKLDPTFDPTADRLTQASQVATAKLAELWSVNRKLLIVAGIGIIFFVGKGLATLWTLLNSLL